MASWLVRSGCHGSNAAAAATARVLTRDSTTIRAIRRPCCGISSQRGFHHTPAAALMGSSKYKTDEQNKTLLVNQVIQLINSDSSKDPDKDIKVWWAVQTALNHLVSKDDIDRALTHKQNQVNEEKEVQEGLPIISHVPQECEFEGTGPHGIHFLVRCLTKSNRTDMFERIRSIVEEEQKCKMGIENVESMHHVSYSIGFKNAIHARKKQLKAKLSWSKPEITEDKNNPSSTLSNLFSRQQGKILVASPYLVALRACDGDEEEVEDVQGLNEQEEIVNLMEWIEDTELLDKNTPYAVELSTEKSFSTPKRVLVSVEAENFYTLLRELEANGKVVDDARLEYQPKRQTYAVDIKFRSQMREIETFIKALHTEEDVVQVVHNGWFED